MKLLITSSLLLLFTIFQTDDYSKAHNEFKNKEYKSTIETCSKALTKLSPKDSLYTKLLTLRGDSYTLLGEWKLSIQDYLILSKNDPKNLRFYINLSYAYGSLGQTKNCADILLAALKIDPRNVIIRNNISYYAGQSGAYELAMLEANRGLALATDSSMRGSLLNNRGFVYLKQKKYTLALADINEAIKLDPDNSFAYCYRALVNIKLKKPETVCVDLNKARSLGAVTLTADLIKQNCKN
jgi:tetratricopeptide (TPR) repeat protein